LTEEQKAAKEAARFESRKARTGFTDKAQVWRTPKTEMGFQTIVGVPAAYSHYKQGRISEVQSCGVDLKAFYWFAENYTNVGSCDKWEKAPGGYWPESWGFPKELPADFKSAYDQKNLNPTHYHDADIFMRVSGFTKKVLMGHEIKGVGNSMVPKDWEAPPTKAHYAAMKDLPGSKAPTKAKYSIVISNKEKHAAEIKKETKPVLAELDNAQSQAWNDMGNYFSTELKQMLDGVKEHCPDTQIVYVRHRIKDKDTGEESDPGQTNLTGTDYQLMKQYDNVVTMEDVLERNPDVDFNEKQIRVLAKNNCFMSPRGGFQQMAASVAGGKHIVKQVVGSEKDGFYKRQHEQWNATVTVTYSSTQFLQAFQEQILAGGCKMCVLQD